MARTAARAAPPVLAWRVSGAAARDLEFHTCSVSKNVGHDTYLQPTHQL
jgi:hypothetical protein